MTNSNDNLERELLEMPPTEREAVRWVVQELRRFLHPVPLDSWTLAHLEQFERERLSVMPAAAKQPFRMGLASLRDLLHAGNAKTRPPRFAERSFDQTQDGGLFAVTQSGNTQEIKIRPPRPVTRKTRGVDLGRTHLGVDRQSPNDS